MDFPRTKDQGLLTLYVRFETLPVSVFTEMIGAIDALYNAVAKVRVPELLLGSDSAALLRVGAGPVATPLFPPLVIDSASTGQSLTIRFRPSRNPFPSFSTDEKGDVQVLLPKWAAALMIAGTMLDYAQDRYKNHVEIERAQVETEMMRIQIEKLRQETESEQIREELQQFEDRLQSPTDPRVRANIDRCISQFYLAVLDPHVLQAELNGVALKDSRPEQVESTSA